MSRAASGLLAGLVATAPMTAVMLAGHARLPRRERYALPPEEITVALADEAGLDAVVEDPVGRLAATLAGHFGYGAAAGLAYALSAARLRAHPALKGAGFGLLVWVGSYLGWLPAVGILTPATEHPPRRTLLMVAAHLAWGSATGVLVDRAGHAPKA